MLMLVAAESVRRCRPWVRRSGASARPRLWTRAQTITPGLRSIALSTIGRASDAHAPELPTAVRRIPGGVAGAASGRAALHDGGGHERALASHAHHGRYPGPRPVRGVSRQSG